MDELHAPRPLAVVTGASSGIGFHLALCAADHGYDLLLAADRPLQQAVDECRRAGARVEAVQCDLASSAGVRQLLHAIGDREVDALLANAGHGLAGCFLEQRWDDILHVINTNVTGTVYLVHEVAAMMRRRAHGVGHGHILITGSVAGFQPGGLHAVYNGTKAFVDSFAMALRSELRDTRISITCLIPGPTDTEFFERAGLLHTPMGGMPKMDPARVARIGFRAMLEGEADVVAGLANKAQVALSKVLPAQMVAAVHRRFAQPQGQAQTASDPRSKHDEEVPQAHGGQAGRPVRQGGERFQQDRQGPPYAEERGQAHAAQPQRPRTAAGHQPEPGAQGRIEPGRRPA